MLPVSSEFHDQMKATVRKVYGRVTIDYTDPFIDQSIETSANNIAPPSSPDQTANNIENPAQKWADIDESWELDGTFHLMPGDGSEEIGWWSFSFANANGHFVTNPTLTVTFFSRPIHSLKVVGDSAREEYPIDFTITLYDESDNMLYQEVVVGNTEIHWQKNIETVLRCTKMTLEVEKWSHPGRRVKILEFFTVVQETYEGDDILMIGLQEEREFSDGSLPIGNISANEIEVRLNNIDRKFDAGNNRSPLYQLLKANRRIRAWIGTQIPGKMVQQSPVSAWQPQPSISSKTEWTPLGVYWSGDWEVPEDEVWAHTTGRDRMELLRKSTYSTSQVVHNTNLYELSEIVLKDSGLEENQYWIDPELLEFEVPYAWFDAQPHRSVLRKIAEACLGQVYADRHGIVRIEGPSFLQNERQTSQITISRDDYFEKNQPVKWSEIANYIEVETAPLRPDVEQEVYRSNEPIHISAGQTETHTVYYNEPPVIDAVASLDGVGIITNVNYYAWGADVTVTSSIDGEFEIVVTGKPLKVMNKERVVRQDEASIIDNGRLRYQFPENHLIQKRDVAVKIAETLLESFKDPRRDIELTWRGNPAVELGDRFTAPDYKDVNEADFHVVSQSLEYDGTLQCTVQGRRAING